MDARIDCMDLSAAVGGPDELLTAPHADGIKDIEGRSVGDLVLEMRLASQNTESVTGSSSYRPKADDYGPVRSQNKRENYFGMLFREQYSRFMYLIC